MIKKYSLNFVSKEVEQLYRQSTLLGLKNRREITLFVICLYLIILIVKLNSQDQIILCIIVGIALAAELVIFFLTKKYWEKKEIFITVNMVIIAFISDSLRLYGAETDQWFYGQHLSIVKLIVYLQGNSYRSQSFLFICTQGMSIYGLKKYDVTSIVLQCIITVILILLRYQYEITNRQLYLAKLSKEQYEVIIEDLLPSWVVIVRYDKLSAQLQIDKINKKIKEKFDIKDHYSFRDFLRKLTIIPYDQETYNQQHSIKLEQELINILKKKDSSLLIEKYHGILEKSPDSNKQWKFQITQVYFKAFEPHVLLLFEEIKEGKYDTLLNQIQHRDQSSYCNSRISLQKITQHYQLIQSIQTQLKLLSTGNPIKNINVLNEAYLNLKKQIQICQSLYNLNFNLFNIFKIQHHQLRYELNAINLDKFQKEMCDNFSLKSKISENENHLLMTEDKDVIRTDKNKLVSIIINLIEFIKIVLSISQHNENLESEMQPNGIPFVFSMKKSQNDQIKITLSHEKFYIDHKIVEQINNLEHLTCDHKKRNWNTKNYFEIMYQLNHTLKDLLVHYKRENKSPSLIEYDSIGLPSNEESKLTVSQPEIGQSFSTLGYVIAQYLVSQIGPSNKIKFKQKNKDIKSIPFSCYENLRQTKIQFYIYQDLKNFIQQISRSEQQLIIDIQVQKRKHSESELSSRLRQFSTSARPKKYY